VLLDASIARNNRGRNWQPWLSTMTSAIAGQPEKGIADAPVSFPRKGYEE